MKRNMNLARPVASDTGHIWLNIARAFFCVFIAWGYVTFYLTYGPTP
jgi:hypothetical protein